jgi:acetyl-CoA synthetase
VLGSVGEPINPEAWHWYSSVVGGGRCSIVDTYWQVRAPAAESSGCVSWCSYQRQLSRMWSTRSLLPPTPPPTPCPQTETGGIIVSPLPGCTPQKPGSATFPFFGVEIVLKDRDGRVLEGNDVSGVVCVRSPWPALARTVYGDHDRYLSTYLRPFPGSYFTGDGAIRDKDGYLWITGRVDGAWERAVGTALAGVRRRRGAAQSTALLTLTSLTHVLPHSLPLPADVLNVSGHRLGSAEIESALVAHHKVAEAAVIGFPHETKGEGICCYVTLKEGVAESDEIAAELRNQVRARKAARTRGAGRAGWPGGGC